MMRNEELNNPHFTGDLRYGPAEQVNELESGGHKNSSARSPEPISLQGKKQPIVETHDIVKKDEFWSSR